MDGHVTSGGEVLLRLMIDWFSVVYVLARSRVDGKQKPALDVPRTIHSAGFAFGSAQGVGDLLKPVRPGFLSFCCGLRYRLRVSCQ